MGEGQFGIDPDTTSRLAGEIKSAKEAGHELCLVVGGGNIFRGLAGAAKGFDRSTADYMGMLATVMNALAMQNALERIGVHTRVLSAIPMATVSEPYIRRRAVRHIEKGRVVIFAAGTGNPYFTTDTAAALRAAEMGCDALFKGTSVDGVYDADPKKVQAAKRYESVSFNRVLADDLKVMDASAIALCRDNNIPIVVFNIREQGNLARVLSGEGVATIVRNEEDEMPAYDKADLQRRMHGAVEALKHDLGGLRTGRASITLLEPVHVEVYGANMPLNQVATISAPEPRMLSVQVWDRSNVGTVEKAIRSAGLGLNPVTEGQNIRLPIPDLTEERRKELAKLAGQYAEKAKIAVRNVRRDGMDGLKQDEKKHEISEDERKRFETEVQKLTDETIAEIDAAAASKEKEILQR